MNNLLLKIENRVTNKMIKIHDISLCRDKLLAMFSSGPFVHEVNPHDSWITSIANDPNDP